MLHGVISANSKDVVHTGTRGDKRWGTDEVPLVGIPAHWPVSAIARAVPQGTVWLQSPELDVVRPLNHDCGDEACKVASEIIPPRPCFGAVLIRLVHNALFWSNTKEIYSARCDGYCCGWTDEILIAYSHLIIPEATNIGVRTPVKMIHEVIHAKVDLLH